MLFEILGWIALMFVALTFAPRIVAVLFMCTYALNKYDLCFFSTPGEGRFPFIIAYLLFGIIAIIIDYYCDNLLAEDHKPNNEKKSGKP